MNNVLLTLGALLVGILSALVAVPMVVDWNSYRGVFEEEASRILNRDVRLGGAVAVRFLPVPYVRFEKLRIADIASTGGDPLFRAESLTMRLSIGALLRGTLEAGAVELKKPALRLAVDSSGQGNWASLAIAPGSLPFVPSDVALKSVDMSKGTLTLVNATGKELAVFDGLDGEFAADGASGPFRFKGTMSWSGGGTGAPALREVRLSTGAFEADGGLRVRASAKVPSNGNSYVFEGRLHDVREKMKIDGELSAKFPIGAPPAARESKGSDRKGEEPKVEDAHATYELKAKLDGDVDGARLSDLSLSLDSPIDPQLITGEVIMGWGAAARFDMTLASKSLNLDKFAAAGGDSDPLDTARAALNIVLAALPAEAETNARLRADRVVLSGETVTGVSVSMTRSGPQLELKSLKAELPGSTRLEASGIISRDTRTLAFSGPVRVRGGNLARFTGWARGSGGKAREERGAPAAGKRYDGPFALEGELAMTGGSIELRSANAEFGGMPISGGLLVTTDDRRRIALTLDGRRIDFAQIWPGAFDGDRLRAALTGGPAAVALRPESAHADRNGLLGFDAAGTDLALDIRADELKVNGGLELKDVDLAIKVEKGAIAFERVRFATLSGLALDVEGKLSDITPTGQAAGRSTTSASRGSADTGTARAGSIRWIVSTPAPTAVAELIEALQWPAELQPAEATIAALGPARFAGTTVLGAKGGRGVDVTFDGEVDGGRVNGTARLDQSLADWRTAQLQVATTIETGRIERWLDLTGVQTPASAGATSTSARSFGRGTLFLRAEGRADSGLTTYATLAAKDVSIAYQGLVALPSAEAGARAEGSLALNARDAGEVLALSGIAPSSGPAGVPLSGQVKVAMADRKLRLETQELSVGQSTLAGVANVSFDSAASTGRSRTITARLSADSVSIPGLLSAVSEHRAGAVAAVSNDGDGPWSAEPLTFAALDGISGRIELSTQRLVLDGSAALQSAKTEITLAPGRVSVDGLQGTGLGGTLNASAVLQRIAGGAQFSAEGTFDNADAAKFVASAAVPFSVQASLRGQGISARGIAAAVSGRGEVSIGGGRIAGVAPSAVAAVADRVIEAKDVPDAAGIRGMVEQGLAQSFLDVRARKVPFTLSEGIAKLSVPTVETDSGHARADVTLDLSNLTMSNDWRIEAQTKPLPSGRVKGRLPAIVISSMRSLTAHQDAVSLLATQAFEQEVALRKFERDADELERARKLAEEQRLKAEAEEAARAAAAKAAAEEAARAAAATQSGGTPAAGAQGGTTSPAPGGAPAEAAPSTAAGAQGAGLVPGPAPGDRSGLAGPTPQQGVNAPAGQPPGDNGAVAGAPAQGGAGAAPLIVPQPQRAIRPSGSAARQKRDEPFFTPFQNP